MRQRKLKRLWQRLKDLQQQTLTRDQLLIKLGGAKRDAGRAYSLVTIDVSQQDNDCDQAFIASAPRAGTCCARTSPMMCEVVLQLTVDRPSRN